MGDDKPATNGVSHSGSAPSLFTVSTLKQRARKARSMAATSYMVAYDGSAISSRAVRLAAYLRGSLDTIYIFSIFTSPAEEKEFTTAHRQLVSDLRATCSVPHASIKTQCIKLQDGASLKEALVDAANKEGLDGRHGLLLMGAAGKGMEAAEKTKGQRPSGQAPMGSVAEECMRRVKVPVLLVKNNSTTTRALNTESGMQDRMMDKESAAMHIVCCIDGSSVAKKTFDAAIHLCKPNDKVTVLHVLDSDNQVIRGTTEHLLSMGDSAIRSTFTEECAKASAVKTDCTFAFKEVQKKGTIRDTVVKTTDDLAADLLIMGSIELGKIRTGVDATVMMGSVSANVAKITSGHCLIVKNFASTSIA